MSDLTEMSNEELEEQLNKEQELSDSLVIELRELEECVEEMEESLHATDFNSNEWKTRYSCQMELKKLLSSRVSELTEKVDGVKRELKELKLTKNADQMRGGGLEGVAEKEELLGFQLRNLELRLEQEIKAFHKAHEERKILASELTQSRSVVDLKPFNVPSRFASQSIMN